MLGSVSSLLCPSSPCPCLSHSDSLVSWQEHAGVCSPPPPSPYTFTNASKSLRELELSWKFKLSSLSYSQRELSGSRRGSEILEVPPESPWMDSCWLLFTWVNHIWKNELKESISNTFLNVFLHAPVSLACQSEVSWLIYTMPTSGKLSSMKGSQSWKGSNSRRKMNNKLQIRHWFRRDIISVVFWHDSGSWFRTTKSGRRQARISHDPVWAVYVPLWCANESAIPEPAKRPWLTSALWSRSAHCPPWSSCYDSQQFVILVQPPLYLANSKPHEGRALICLLLGPHG